MKNKLLVISGGSKGIGRSIVLKFAKMNFDIITCSRNLDDLNKFLENDMHKNKDVIYGNRFHKSSNYKMPLHRRFGSKIFKPPSSRKDSKESFIICKNLR